MQGIHIGGDQYVYDIWISPVTGEDVQRCPWLRKLPNKEKYICRIHDVKPEHCRAYPKSKKHASLMFHQGAKIPGYHPLLEGDTMTSRSMKIASIEDAEKNKSEC